MTSAKSENTDDIIFECHGKERLRIARDGFFVDGKLVPDSNPIAIYSAFATWLWETKGGPAPFEPESLRAKLADLHKQATTERSHYYTEKVVKEAIDGIESLLDVVLDVFSQATLRETDSGRLVYDHNFLSAYEGAQTLLINAKKIRQEDCAME